MSSLTTEQLGRLMRLLDEVVDADDAQRQRWLHALPPEHRDLEPALRKALCPTGDAARRLLDALPLLAEADALEAGQRVGPYRLLRPLGRGGMGEVWLAERADGAFRREVALKTPSRRAARPDLAQRFATERDILAALEHPRIARFYDAGVTEDGRPWLALEHVRGRELLRWADAHGLIARARVELFLQVIDAVQYAHARGVLHRDLKPANVLVNEAGQVHLLDFGVARLVERPADADDLTQAHGVALTPAYASPEQLRHEPLAATSDVYSLGVVLHELLAGALPGAPGKRAVAPELAAIVRKAMAPEAAQRYESAAALGDDLRRHLAHEPVRALPPTLAYRARKLFARRRAGVLQAGLGALVLAGAGAAVWWQWPGGEEDAPAAPAAAASAEGPAERRAEARDLLMQAEVYATGPFERDAERAEVALRRAAALVPDDALPWSKLALLHLARAAASPATREERGAAAREAIDTALRIDPRALAAHAARFRHAVAVEHGWGEARAALDAMRTIDPRDATWLPACEAQLASVTGRLDEAVRIQRRIVARDPHDAAAIAALAGYLFASDRLEEAVALWRRELELNPHAAGTHARIGVALALLGRGEPALAAVGQEPHPGLRLWSLAIAEALLGHRDAAKAALDELKRVPKGNAYALAQVHAAQGQRRAALEWLERACVERQGGCEALRTDRLLRGLRDEPRYRALLARLKLDAEPLPAGQ